MINDYLDRDKLYWIGLNDISKEGKECKFMNFDINCVEGRYVWSESQKETQYQIWWDRVFSIGREPNGNGDCVFKDGYKEPDGEWGWNQFGWADFPCDADFWSKQAIHALCETNHFPHLIWSKCPASQVHDSHQYSLQIRMHISTL